MSVGNINSYGDKKNNFSFQYKVLKGIADVIVAITGVITSIAGVITAITGIATIINPKAKVTNIVRSTTTGTITAGKFSVSFANVGSANGTVKAVTLKPNETINFDAGALNNTLDTIDYDATGTEFLIIYIS